VFGVIEKRLHLFCDALVDSYKRRINHKLAGDRLQEDLENSLPVFFFRTLIRALVQGVMLYGALSQVSPRRTGAGVPKAPRSESASIFRGAFA